MLGTVFAWLSLSASRSWPSTQATASNRANPDTLDKDVPAAMIAALRAEDATAGGAVPAVAGPAMACSGPWSSCTGSGPPRRPALTCQSCRAAGREHR